MKSILFSSLLIFSFFILPISVNADSNGLAGYWKFDEGSGASAYDSSGNGLTGTVSGATWVDGISGKALNFSSVSDYFTMPSNSKLTFPSGNFTIEAWFKLSQNHQAGSSNKWILLKNGEYGLYLNGHNDINGHPDTQNHNGNLQFYFSDGYQTSTKNSWDANTWYHVAGVHSSDGSWKIYINGVLDASGNKSYFTTATCSFDVGNFLGCQTAHDNFVGAIDEVKIYSRALSASEILAEYQFFPIPTSTSTTTTTTSSTSTFSTWCTNWANKGCGISPCYSNQMKQTQNCGYSNSSGYSSQWENSKCVANETCSAKVCTADVKQCPDGSYVSRNPNNGCEFYSCPSQTTDRMLKTIAVSSAKCINTGIGNKIYFTVQNVGTKDILARELKASIDGQQIYYIDELPIISETNLPANAQQQFSLGMSNFANTRTLEVAGPSNMMQLSLTCSANITVCAQIITPAKNPATNECKNFATPCDVPSGWIKTDTCPIQQVQCAFANLDVKKADVSYDFSGVSSTANITVYNSGSEDLYNFSFIIITDKGIYTFNPINQYSEAYPLAKGTTTLFKTINYANNAPSSTETVNTIRITALCKKDYRISTEINMQSTDGGSSLPSISPIKEVDKTVLLDVLFGLEQVKIKLDGLKDSALAISDYYGGKGDSAKAGKWLEISSTFNGVINTIDGITAEIKQNKNNITADFIKQIKTKVAGVKADISSVIDKVIEVM